MPTHDKQTIVLGSSSTFRKDLLEKLQIEFLIASPDIDETPRIGESAIKLVERLAIEKAQEVAKRHTNSLIIGSDQVAMHGDTIIGKPNNHKEAVAQLKQASGKKVTLHTGLALLNTETGNIQSKVIPFHVHFRVLSDEMIEAYLKKDQPYNCAGSVRSERLGIALFERLEGEDPNALVGLPLIELTTMLAAEGYSVLI